MANELQHRYLLTAANLYATVRNAAGQYYNGSAFETLVVANWGNYDIALTESPASSYFYVGSFPALAAGPYTVDLYLRDGASPAITDTPIAVRTLRWNGTAEIEALPSYAPGGAGGLALYNDPMALTAAERNAVADAALSRAVSNVEGTADKHSLAYVILVLSEASTASGALVVNQSDGVTVFTTKTATFDANARPITGIS